MEQELQQIKAKLRKTETKEKSAPLTNKDLTEEENQTIKDDFFNSGAQNWYSLIKEFTFETCFLPLDKKEALGFIHFYKFLCHYSFVNPTFCYIIYMYIFF